jgi:hypothetical protein
VVFRWSVTDADRRLKDPSLRDVTLFSSKFTDFSEEEVSSTFAVEEQAQEDARVKESAKLNLLVGTEDGGEMFLRNATSHVRRLNSS